MNKPNGYKPVKGSEQFSYPPPTQGVKPIAPIEQQPNREQPVQDKEQAIEIAKPDVGVTESADYTIGNLAPAPFSTIRYQPDMERPPQPATAAHEYEIPWKDRIRAAKACWSELTEDELLRSEGHEQRLASLVRTHYAVSSEEASKQVQAFLARQKT